MKNLRVKSYGIRTYFFLLLAAATMLSGCTGEKQEDVSNQETVREISQLMRKVNSAFRKKDLATLAESLADDYRFTLPNGTILDKKQILVAAREERLRNIEPEIDEINIRRFGNFAILTAQAKINMEIEGAAFKGVFRGGGSFVKTEGKWKVVDEYVGIPVIK